MNGEPVITAKEMKRLETLAFKEGENEEEYMENAGSGIASVLEEELVTPRGSGPIYLLIGKGNNGGDAFVAGELLRKKGFEVIALLLHLVTECSPLSQKMSKRFSGEKKPIDAAPIFEKGVILDGIFGTGFQGKAEGLASEVIESANSSNLPIYAIDIPSGLNGDTGEVTGPCIKAKKTIYLGLPKMGFFLDQGWNHVGKLQKVDFGLPEKYIEDAECMGYLIDEKKAFQKMPPMERSRHKYQAGYVIAIAGSPSMPGAAILACFAALKTGAGIVRLFHPEGMKEELSFSPHELIKEAWDLKDHTRIFEEAKRAKAIILGPGMGRDEKTDQALNLLLEKITLPTVIDADALYFLAKNKEENFPETTILTPHHQEMARILGEEPSVEACGAYSNEKKVTVVLKGAPTIIFHPHTKPLIIPHGDPGMATAGTGDVLTGMIASLLAQGLGPRDSSGLGCLLHALSGELAAKEETSYSVVATDLIHYLSEVIKENI